MPIWLTQQIVNTIISVACRKTASQEHLYKDIVSQLRESFRLPCNNGLDRFGINDPWFCKKDCGQVEVSTR